MCIAVTTNAWKTEVHPRDLLEFTVADRRCSRDDARLCTPPLADADTRRRAMAFFYPPMPQCHCQERQCQMTLERYNLARLAHVLCLVSRGEKERFLVLQKKGAFWSQQSDQVRGDLSWDSGLVRGACVDSGVSAGLTCGPASKPGSNAKLLCSGWCLYHEF